MSSHITAADAGCCNLSNNNTHVSCLSDLYDVVGAAASLSLQNTFIPLPNTSAFSPKSSGGGEMGGNSYKGSGFTVRQWKELEIQMMICKYMMASIPVPSHLLLNLSNTNTFPSALPTSPSNLYTSSCRLDLRYTRGGGGNNNDAEPWRCRRTDGKKWRCSRDVAPYQKYCERHAHKPKSRSRKPVENTNTSTNLSNSFIDNNNNDSTSSQALQKQVFNVPAMISSGETLRCTEWFMKGDPIPGSALNDEWQGLAEPSPKGLKLYDEHNNRTVSVFQKQYDKEKESLHTNTYLSTNSDRSFQNRTTRHFIDAWSCLDKELETGHVSNNQMKLPVSSLTLSMSTENDDDERQNGKRFKTDWLNSDASYTCVPPGGPLGEALCLGISSNNSSSSCSKSSCEDTTHGRLRFH